MRSTFAVLAFCAVISVGCNDPEATKSEPRVPDDQAASPDAKQSETPDAPVTQQNVLTNAQETLETAQQLVAQEQKEYRQQVAARLDKIQQHIDALNQQLEKSPPTAGVANLRKTFQRLEQQLANARKKAEEETAETRKAWDELKAEVDDAIGQLEASTADARKQFEAEKGQQVDGDEQPKGDRQTDKNGNQENEPSPADAESNEKAEPKGDSSA